VKSLKQEPSYNVSLKEQKGGEMVKRSQLSRTAGWK
jgi:hypothetical protein